MILRMLFLLAVPLLLLSACMQPIQPQVNQDSTVWYIVTIQFTEQEQLDGLGARYDVWEVHKDRDGQGSLVARVTEDEYNILLESRYSTQLHCKLMRQYEASLNLPASRLDQLCKAA